MAANQHYWEMGDWEAVETALNEGLAIELDHNLLEDIRRRIFLLEHPQAGADTSDSYYEGYEYAPQPGLSPGNEIYYYIGQWQVTWYDPECGWQWWYNKIDMTRDMVRGNHPPPVNIHPEDNAWIYSNDYWQLMADPNRYHHWDKNAPHMHVVEQSVGSEEMEDLQISLSQGLAYKWLSRQVDPKEQLVPVRYKDTGQRSWQYKSKVEIKRKQITQPDTLGTVWSCWRYDILNGNDNIVCTDPWGWMWQGVLLGYQYANYGSVSAGCQNENTPGFGAFLQSLYPDRMPLSGAFGEPDEKYIEWRWNPKLNWAYQNRIEMLLEGLCGRLPADSAYDANFRDRYDVEEGEEDQNSNYESHPAVTADEWGENESGWELYLKKYGEYDWYFDFNHPYYPKYVVEAVMDQIINHDHTWEEEIAAYDLSGDGIGISDPTLGMLAGTWRRTWEHTMGRVSPFMRSKEMGEPSRHDSWSFGGGFWFGARSRHYPAISEFDNKFETIIDSIDDYTFAVNGDITDDLKPHWLVHLATSQSQKIYENEVWMTYANVVKISYDSDTGKTTIKLTCPHTGYSLICWNKEISLRHDAKRITWKQEDETWVGYPEYDNVLQIIWDMRKILMFAKYVRLNVGSQAKRFSDTGASSVPCYSAGAALQNAAQNLWEKYEDSLPVDTWPPTGWPNSVRASSDAYCTGAPYWLWVGEQCWDEIAVKFTGNALAMAKLHKHITVKVKYSSCALLSEQTVPQWYPCTLGVGETSIQQPVEGYPILYHYRYISFPLFHYDEGYFSRICIENGLPGILYPNDGVVDGEYYILIGLYFDTPFVVVDWDNNIPESIFERCMIGHVDIEETPIEDIKPPRPNPPIHHNLPQAYFKYIPAEGEEPEYFELRIKGDSCRCEDYEGSDPVKYWAIEANNNVESEWSASRQYDCHVRDLTIEEAVGEEKHENLNNAATSNPSETRTRIMFQLAEEIDIEEPISILGTTYNNGVWFVVEIGEGWFDIDKGSYTQETIPGTATIDYKTAGYIEDDWNEEACRLWQFKLQAKDSAQPQNNLTGFSTLKTVIIPSEWPEEIYNLIMNLPPD